MILLPTIKAFGAEIELDVIVLMLRYDNQRSSEFAYNGERVGSSSFFATLLTDLVPVDVPDRHLSVRIMGITLAISKFVDVNVTFPG